MATITTNKTRNFKDLDLNFMSHPVRKDVTKHTGDLAVINSIKNLILTNHYERLFQPYLGSNIKKLLFENMDTITSVSLEREIQQVIENFESRAKISRISVLPDYDNNGYTVDMEFSIINQTEPTQITFFLERVR
jgi:phage baseplate assembly protein W